jgi:hypothetical protein
VDVICMRRSISCMVVVLMAAFHLSRPKLMLSEDELRAAEELTAPDGSDPTIVLPFVPLLPRPAEGGSAEGWPSEPTPVGSCATWSPGNGGRTSLADATSTSTTVNPPAHGSVGFGVPTSELLLLCWPQDLQLGPGPLLDWDCVSRVGLGGSSMCL